MISCLLVTVDIFAPFSEFWDTAAYRQKSRISQIMVYLRPLSCQGWSRRNFRTQFG